MKIIFLDIDGVLNWAGTEDRINGFIGLCPIRIQRFNRIIDAHPDAKIVISSTWRKSGLFGAYEGFEGLVKLLAERGVKGEIIGHTPIRFSYASRGNEIRDWLNSNATDQDHDFIVLDDSTDGMDGFDLRHRQVQTYWEGVLLDQGRDEPYASEEGGLSDRDIDQAIKMLEKP